MTLLPSHPSLASDLHQRPKRKRAHPEQTLQRQVADFLSVALAGNSWWSTMPLGGGGSIRGKILRGLGTRAGLPDLLVVNDGRAIWLELKSKNGRLSEVQQECHAALARARCPVTVCRHLDDVIAALRAAGVPLKLAGETWVTPDPLVFRDRAVT